MGDLTEMIKQYTVKHDHKLKKICEPLKECFGIDSFFYCVLEPDGRLIKLSNDPETLLFYYTHNLYLEDPFLSHPHLFRSGNLLIPETFEIKHFKVTREKFQHRHMLFIIQHHGEAMETCFFSTKDVNNSAVFFANLSLMYQFLNFFKKEMRQLIERMKTDGFNIKQEKGKAFLQCQLATPLLNKDPNIERFLKLMFPLSARERQCLQLFKHGKSAQMTGAILGISQRTVESYFENIKVKLGCHSKADLLEW